eukprot:c28293_g1_i1 orf=598-1968(+)
MESLGSNYESHRSGRRYGFQFSSPSLLLGPLSTFLEFSGLFRGRHHYTELDEQASGGTGLMNAVIDSDRINDGRAEVSIRIIGGGENENLRLPSAGIVSLIRDTGEGSSSSSQDSSPTLQNIRPISGTDGVTPSVTLRNVNTEENGDGLQVVSTENNRENASQRYGFQQLARWIEQVLPFAILLLMVFIRQHLEGFLVSFWISAVMVKANDLLRKQTALKGERKTFMLLVISSVLLCHIIAVYSWYWRGDFLRPLLMIPPKEIPKFWQAIFILVVNDTMVRQAAMVIKSGILILYKNSRGRAYRRQVQLLTLIEYILLLYRALLPAPVWYRFFLNKEYGNLFSSLTTGLYLTFKLTSTLEKVQRFFTAVKAFSRREVQYGSYATSEEVLAAGDMCAICQENLHAPVSLRCKHIFCEDCVSEWFERERTCPLCRAVVKSAGLRSFGDGSTSLLFQIF